MIAVAALLLATAFPSSSRTSWMRPESFHLVIGMKREAAMTALHEFGWKPHKEKETGDLTVDYADDKSFTMHFERDRLHAIRFELFTIVGQARDAFDEEKSALREAFGAPKKVTPKTVVLYDDRLPNVMVVLNDDPKSEMGQKGVGMLIVRYYDPR